MDRLWRQASPDSPGHQGHERVSWTDEHEGLLRDFLRASRLEEAFAAHDRPEAGRAVRDGVVVLAGQAREAREEGAR